MSFPGVIVDVGSSNLLANINIPDAVPALVGSKDVFSEWPMTIHMMGMNGVNSPEVENFFNEVGGSADLRIVGIDMSKGTTTIVDKLRNFLVDNPDVNLVGLVYSGTTTFTKYGALANEVGDLVFPLQNMLEERAAAGCPVRLFLNAVINNTKEINYSPDELASNRVALVLGGSDDDTSGVGIALGRATKIPAHIKLGDGSLGPLAVSDISWSGNTLSDIGYSVIESWHDMGFMTFMRRPGREGWYFGVDWMCSNDDFSILAHGRVVDKVQRLAIAAYMPYIETPMQMADDGTIDAADAESMAKVIESQIRARMSEQISNVKVIVPVEQDLINTHALVVKVRVLPLGYNTWINVTINLANKL